VTSDPRELQKDAHGAIGLEPIRAEGPHRREIDGTAVHLAALHGKEHRAAVGVAADDLEVQSESVAQDHRNIVARRPLVAAAQYERRTARLSRLRDRGRRRVGPHHQEVSIVAEARR
jgi:hypothetical protein